MVFSTGGMDNQWSVVDGTYAVGLEILEAR
jgi:hypothetical protein